MSFIIPVERLIDTPHLLAFHHPRPSYPLHILLLPKRAIRSLTDLNETDTEFMIDLYRSVGRLVQELGLEQKGYRLIANGGPYQDIPQLHFHLVSGA